MSRRIQILDTTLRDGEQSPGIALQPHEKAEIAAQLERLGVDVVEAGFPGASPGDFEGVRAVAAAVTRANRRRVRAHPPRGHRGCRPRARRREALADPPRPRHERAAHGEEARGSSPHEVVRQARWAVEYAAERADEVEFSCEDATRSDPAFVALVCRAAIAAGVTVINLPDTVGYALPAQYAAFIEEVRERCPELREVTLSVHCHDDLGLSVANSLAGIEAGAGQVECTINGLGERAGNASLEEIVVALKVRSDHYDVETGIDTDADRCDVAPRRRAARAISSSATRPSSARTRSRTRPACTRTAC